MNEAQLIKAAALAASSIKSGILELGAILHEINCRYKQEGMALACETLGLSEILAQRFIAAHRGVLRSDIALGTVPFANRLEKLNLSQQNEIVEKGFTFIERIGTKGKLRTRLKATLIPVTQLDSTHVAQLFDGPRLRNEAQQTQYLKDTEGDTNPTKARVAIKTWEIKNNKLVIHQPLFFSKKDLQGIIKKMK